MTKMEQLTGYKVLTHDLCSPIQGGAPIFDGTCPYTLPDVELDTSGKECGKGWNFCASGEDALRIAGFWSNGRSSRVFEVSTENGITRGDKCRASSLSIVRELPESEIDQFISTLSVQWFTDLAQHMLAEQRAWRWVMGRGFDTGNAKNVRTRALDALDALDARDAWGAWGAWDALDALDAWDARSARGAWDARSACMVYYVCVLRQWHPLPPSYAWMKNGIVSMLPRGWDELNSEVLNA